MYKRKLFTSQVTAASLLLCSSMALAACSDLRHATFACEDGREGSVTWRADKTAVVSFHGDSWFLHQLPSSETELRYGDGVHEIWEHKGTIKVKTDNTPDAMCRSTDD